MPVIARSKATKQSQIISISYRLLRFARNDKNGTFRLFTTSSNMKASEYYKKEDFHNKHEMYTEIAYNTSGMLPHRYVFVLTNLCNLRCHFCYQAKNYHKNSMEKEDWINLGKQLPDYARVTLTGGEPLIFPGFKELFPYIAERFDCNLITNGILLNEDFIDFLLSFPKFKVLSISVDNIGNTLRDVKKEQWKHVEGIMHHFVNRRDELGSDCILDLKTLVLDENADELLSIHQYCVEDIGCDYHTFQFLKGSPIQHADNMFSLDDIFIKHGVPSYKKFGVIKQELEKVREYNVKTGSVGFLHPKVASLTSGKQLNDIDCLNATKHIPSRYLPCKFPWSSVHINSDGELFPCLAVSMGNVKEVSLSKIINSEIYSCFRSLIRDKGSVEACNRCGWLQPLELGGVLS